MKSILLSIHLIVAILLATVILLQSGKGGLGKAFGDTVYRSKRGAERIIFVTTFILATIFFITSVANLLIK